MLIGLQRRSESHEQNAQQARDGDRSHHVPRNAPHTQAHAVSSRTPSARARSPLPRSPGC
jgi:hypothetical protein